MVNQPMDPWAQDDGQDSDEHESAEQGVNRRKHLGD